MSVYLSHVCNTAERQRFVKEERICISTMHFVLSIPVTLLQFKTRAFTRANKCASQVSTNADGCNLGAHDKPC